MVCSTDEMATVTAGVGVDTADVCGPLWQPVS